MRRLPAGARWALRAGVTLALVGWIALHVDLHGVGRTMWRVRPGWVAAALLVYVAGQGMSAWKWSLLGRAVGFERPLADYVRFYFIGMFFNLFGPSTLGGDMARGLYLGGGQRPALALNSVIFDRVSGLAVLMALGAVTVLAFPAYALPAPLVILFAGGGAAIVLGWWTCPWLVRLLPADNRVRRMVEGELAPFWRNPRLLGRVAAVSLAFHLSQVGVQWLLARATGTAIPHAYCLVYHPVVSVMAALPVSIAGFGVRETGYLYFLTRAGWNLPEVAVTIGLLWFTVNLLAGLLGGLLFLAAGAKLPPLKTRRPEAVPS